MSDGVIPEMTDEAFEAEMARIAELAALAQGVNAGSANRPLQLIERMALACAAPTAQDVKEPPAEPTQARELGGVEWWRVLLTLAAFAVAIFGIGYSTGHAVARRTEPPTYCTVIPSGAVTPPEPMPGDWRKT